MSMDVIPAIDLRGGKVVRLHQGDYARERIYGDDPAETARAFAAAGARWLHVVDLDGARTGVAHNAGAVQAIVHAVAIGVEFGGGLRSDEAIDRALAGGAARIVLGTAAVRDPALVARALERHGAEAVVVGLDARDGVLAVQGWTESGLVAAESMFADMAAMGVRRFIYTDIARDGTLESPNFAQVEQIVARAAAMPSSPRLVASGGITELEHLRRLADCGVEAAIVGAALYEGRLDLAEAIRAASG